MQTILTVTMHPHNFIDVVNETVNVNGTVYDLWTLTKTDKACNKIAPETFEELYPKVYNDGIVVEVYPTELVYSTGGDAPLDEFQRKCVPSQYPKVNYILLNFNGEHTL
jgi:hypothetical protein